MLFLLMYRMTRLTETPSRGVCGAGGGGGGRGGDSSLLPENDGLISPTSLRYLPLLP